MDTEKIVATAEPAEATAVADTIEYYPAEGDEDSPPAEVGAEDTAEDVSAEPRPSTPSPTRPVAETKLVVPPLPAESREPAPEVLQYRQALAAQQQMLEQQAQQMATLQLERELDGLHREWASQGFSEAQIAKGLDDHRAVKQREIALQARERAVEQTVINVQANIQAKAIMATVLQERYGIPFTEVMKFNTPELMHAKAEAFQAKAELAKMQQAKVKPTKLANAGPGSQGATSRDRLVDIVVAGKRPLTPAEWDVVNNRV